MTNKDKLFQMERHYSDGSREHPVVYRVEDANANWNMGRRDFLASAAAVSAMLFALKPVSLFSRELDAESACSPEIRAAQSGIAEKLMFSPDSTRLITRSADDYCKLWAVRENRLIKSYGAGGSEVVYSFTFSPDGKYMAAISDKGYCLFSPETGENAGRFEVEKKGYSKFYFSPDSKYLVFAMEGTRLVQVFSVADFSEKARFSIDDEIGNDIQVSFSLDSKLCVISDYGRLRHSIYIFSLADGKLLLSAETAGHCRDIKFLPDGKRFVCSTQTSGYEQFDYVYSIDLMNLRGRIIKTLHKIIGKPRFFGFSADMKRLIVQDSLNTVIIYSVPEFTVVKKLAYGKKGISQVLVSPDSRYMAVLIEGTIETNGKEFIEFFDMKKGTPAGKVPELSWYDNTAILDPAGTAIIGVNMKHTVEFLKIPSGVSAGSLEQNSNIQYQFIKGVSPDGKMFAISDSDGKIRIYSYPELSLLYCLYDPEALSSAFTVRQYEIKEPDGTVKYGAVPGAGKVPSGAVCTCDTVSGKADDSARRPFEPERPRSSGGGGGGSYCTCNRICTCVPVK